MAWIGNISEDVRVCFTWGALNIKTRDAFLHKDNTVFGNTGIGTSAYIDDRILQMLFNIKLWTVQSYQDSSDKKLLLKMVSLMMIAAHGPACLKIGSEIKK